MQTSDSLDFFKKADCVGLSSFADDCGKEDLVDRVEGDPDPSITQKTLEFLDSIKIPLFLPDKRPHLVELTFRNHQVMQEQAIHLLGVFGGFFQNQKNGFLVNVLYSGCG